MVVPEVYREKSPLSEKDCFVVFDRRKSSFTFPVHVHPEFELNFVDGAAGAQRIIGDSVESIGEKDLVLIANPELKHAWKDGGRSFSNIHEITIQFHPQLLEQYLNKNQFRSIQRLFERASKGVCFGAATIERVQPLLHIITMENDGFYSVMRLFILLHELARNEDYRELSSGAPPEITRSAELLNRLQDYVSQHITDMIRLSDAATLLNMSRSTFARFLQSQTGLNFTDYLLDFRINVAVRKLKGTASIQDVADQCGFNSISYFYRVFKKAKGITPVEFRSNFKKQQVIV
ncbi:AraC family transcriptional regulator [Niabella drilacis]|uniref:AraC-type DNA-binding protein n=1 Tax=Niabella drilacis (strain DSM 25811 / CCM 8410 / CCUG 62505 / LMG 26954 / E90) TaxID=1285928 RepID=A0A1G6WGS5_NIADE|nr:AraC family transcriptional regulator [Niabella drilacis]SDD65011.1 AraC-type DNA-binding protein [Niabella drilacis]